MGETHPLSDLLKSISDKDFHFKINFPVSKLLLWEVHVEFTFLSTVSFFLFFFS